MKCQERRRMSAHEKAHERAGVRFLRARRSTSRFGDTRREWHRADHAVKVVESRTIAGIELPVRYHVVRLTPGAVCSECLLSRHRKRTAALRAAERIR